MNIVVADDTLNDTCVECRRPVAPGEVVIIVDQGPQVYVHRRLVFHLEHFRGAVASDPVAIPEPAPCPVAEIMERYEPVEQVGLWARLIDREAADAQIHGFQPHHLTQVGYCLEQLEQSLASASRNGMGVMG